MASELIEEKLKQLPDLPGCYLMKNQEDEIIYIGKAKKLKKIEFAPISVEHIILKTEKLVSENSSFRILLLQKRIKESLLLEINLIKNTNLITI